MVKMEIKGLLMDPVSNMPVVILRDTENGHFLPIWVGIFEANAIALEMEKVATPRPMTHDLLKNLLAELDARVDRIVINDLKENTFFARIHLTRGDSTLSRRQPAERRDRARAAVAAPRSSSRRRSSRRAAPFAPKVGSGPRAAEEVARRSEPGGARQVPDVELALPDSRRSPRKSSRCTLRLRDHLDHQPEGRSREDHHRHQPRGGDGPEGDEDPSHRPRSPGQQHDVLRRPPRVEKSMFDVLTDPEVKLKDIVVPSGLQEPGHRPGPDLPRQDRVEAPRGDRRPLPAAGQDRRGPAVLRRDPDRHPADAGHDHRQRHGGLDPHPDPDPVLVLRPRGDRRPARDDRQDQGPAQPEPADPRGGHHPARQAHGARQGRPQADRQVFGDKLFKTTISKSVRLEESPAHQESIFTFAPRSSGAAEYYSLSEEVLSRV